MGYTEDVGPIPPQWHEGGSRGSAHVHELDVKREGWMGLFRKEDGVLIGYEAPCACGAKAMIYRCGTHEPPCWVLYRWEEQKPQEANHG